MVNPQRVQLLNQAGPGPGPVAYWMSRDQRVFHNLAPAPKRGPACRVAPLGMLTWEPV